jgi:hypothetical protein
MTDDQKPPTTGQRRYRASVYSLGRALLCAVIICFAWKYWDEARAWFALMAGVGALFWSLKPLKGW